MRNVVAGPYNSKQKPGRTDFTPFKPFRGEQKHLMPIGNIDYNEELRYIKKHIPRIERKPETKVASASKDARFVDLPYSLMLFIFSEAGHLKTPSKFVSIALICKKLRELVYESKTSDVVVWRQFCLKRFPWMYKVQDMRIFWLPHYRKYRKAMSPPLFKSVFVVGCNEPKCLGYLTTTEEFLDPICEHCGDGRKLKLIEDPNEVEEFPKEMFCVKNTSDTTSILIARWLYKKGYKGFVWISKEEYDEGPYYYHYKRKVF